MSNKNPLNNHHEKNDKLKNNFNNQDTNLQNLNLKPNKFFTKKRYIITLSCLGALLCGAVGTAIYFGVNKKTVVVETNPDPRTPEISDTSGKFEITDMSKTVEAIKFKITTKVGEEGTVIGATITIGGKTLTSNEYKYENGLVTIPASTLIKYSGHIYVIPLFEDKTEIYFKYSTIHVDALEDKAFYIPYEATDSGKIEWHSDNTNFVTVDKNTGEVKVNVEAVEGTETILKVNITAIAINSISPYKTANCVIEILPTNVENFDYSLNSDRASYTVSAKSGGTLSGVVRIPGFYDGYPITTVGSFANKTEITQVILPESITCINGLAFYGCSSLAKINFPKVMQDLKSKAFDNTSNSLEIEFENKNSTWKVIGPSISEELNPNSFTAQQIAAEIKKEAWANCTFTRNGVPDEDNKLMYFMTSEITCEVAPTSVEVEGEINIPATVEFSDKRYKVEKLKKSAFNSCAKITKISIPKTITEVEIACFSTCTLLQDIDVDVHNKGLTSLNGVLYTYGFEKLLCYPVGLSKTSKFELPSQTKIIENSAFANNKTLEEFTCAEGSVLEKIYKSAFYNCSNLKTVHFPASMNLVDWLVFLSASNLQSVKFDDPYNWVLYTPGTAVDLTNDITNATKFNNYSDSFCNDGVRKIT